MRIITACSATFCISALLIAQPPGSLDESFNATDVGYGAGDGTNGGSSVYVVSIQPDGKILCGGDFYTYNGTLRNSFARLHADGTLDETFTTGYGINGAVYAMALLPDGKVLVGGAFTSYDNEPCSKIIRLLINGSRDTTFDTGSGPDLVVRAIALQPDGKIMIAGSFTNYNGVVRDRIARIEADGSLDLTFDPGDGPSSAISAMALQSDGKIMITGSFTSYAGTVRNRIARVLENGDLDQAFDPGLGTGGPGLIEAMALTLDGKALIGGSFTSFNGIPRNRIARLHPDGSVDEGFDPGDGANAGVTSIALWSDGRSLIGGPFTSYNGIGRTGVARLDESGGLDTSFDPGPGAIGLVQCIAIQTDDKILLGGSVFNYMSIGLRGITRVLSDGVKDMVFNPVSGANDGVEHVVIQPDGRILITGSFSNYNGTGRRRIARLDPDGYVDPSFDPGTGVNGRIDAIAVQPDGRILIGGIFTQYNGVPVSRFARLDADGSLDTTFSVGSGADNSVEAITIQPDGKILIGGHFLHYNDVARGRIARLESDGGLDTSFYPGSGASTTIHAITLHPDGRILVGGFFTSFSGMPMNRIVRLHPDGSLDDSFDPGSGASSYVSAILLGPDGKILIAGQFVSYAGLPLIRVARIWPDGSPDTTFTTGSGANAWVRSIAYQPDGKVLIGGDFDVYNGVERRSIARVHSDGSVDTAFDPGMGTAPVNGSSSNVRALSLQLDNKVVIGGYFIAYDNIGRNRLARIHAGSTVNMPTYANGQAVRIFPNPTDGVLMVLVDEPGYSGGQLRVLGMDGRVVLEQRITGPRTELDVERLAPGAYLLELPKGHGQRSIQRFVRQ